MAASWSFQFLWHGKQLHQILFQSLDSLQLTQLTWRKKSISESRLDHTKSDFVKENFHVHIISCCLTLMTIYNEAPSPLDNHKFKTTQQEWLMILRKSSGNKIRQAKLPHHIYIDRPPWDFYPLPVASIPMPVVLLWLALAIPPHS